MARFVVGPKIRNLDEAIAWLGTEQAKNMSGKTCQYVPGDVPETYACQLCGDRTDNPQLPANASVRETPNP